MNFTLSLACMGAAARMQSVSGNAQNAGVSTAGTTWYIISNDKKMLHNPFWALQVCSSSLVSISASLASSELACMRSSKIDHMRSQGALACSSHTMEGAVLMFATLAPMADGAIQMTMAVI